LIGIGRTTPPQLPQWYVGRPRLDRLVAEIPAHRLTTVVAGAGYGKSSLIGAWVVGAPAAWLTLERGDVSLASLVPSVVAALRQQLPDLAVDAALELGGASEGESPERAQAIAAHLADALDRSIGEHLTVTLVLDDVQRVAPGSPGARLLEALALEAPTRFHLVILSRDRAPFPIERMRGRGDVLAIEAHDLALTLDEIERLLDISLPERDPELASRILTLTNGWPAAVRLATEATRRGASPRGPEDEAELFAYLAEEVFASEPPATVDFLQAMSVFPRFTVALAEAVGIPNARVLLDELVGRGLFVVHTPGTDDWFAVHGLVRRFVRARLAVGPSQRERLLGAGATWLAGEGMVREAAEALIALADPESTSTFVGRRGRDLIAAGGAADLVRLDAALTGDWRTPEVDDLAGEALLVAGETDEALARLERRTTGDGELPSRVAWLVGRIHWERGQLDLARSVLQRVRIGDDERHDPLVLSYLASAQWALGDVAACRATANHALELATASGDDRALAAALNPIAVLTIQSDPPAAIEHFRRAIAAAHRAGDVFQLIRLSTNAGTVLESQGRYEAALEHQDESVRLAELIGWPNALAAALRARGFTRFRLGRVDEAMADLESARAMWDRLGSGRVTWALRNLGWAHRQRGAIAPARAALERALELTGRQGDVQAQIFVLVELARLLADDDPDEARQMADRALVDARRLEYAEPDALLACGWVCVGAGDEASAASHGEAAEEGGRRASEPAIVAEALELRAIASHEPATRLALLDEALGLWTELGDVPGRLRVEAAVGRLSPDPARRSQGRAAETKLRDLGFRIQPLIRIPGVLSVLRPGGAGEVAIRTLGGFAVVRDGRTVELSEWRSRKARDLLKLLVSRRGRPAPRESIIEALWPDEEPGPLSNRLAVAVATLRGVLDPDRRYESDRFVGGDQETVWLRDGGAAVDVELFLADATAALALAGSGQPSQSIQLLTVAEEAYGGDFLEEDPYADWPVALREQARAAYIAVVRALTVAAEARDDIEATARYALRLLERDPYDEVAHLGLVTALERGRRRGEARRRYRLYVAAMRDLGVEALPFPAVSSNSNLAPP
jgi:ATP/maltotriose-dependent transcriptional regulator MalT/DNA-binding SARP family transcriptional activator